MPLFLSKKEVLVWVKNGAKTIEIRKGNPKRGDIAFFSSGPNKLKLNIIKKETGKITDLIRLDNYNSIIPAAKTLEEAIGYIQTLYGTDKGTFTAYYLSSNK
jgi:ASC-1-like (ASCH) protein